MNIIEIVQNALLMFPKISEVCNEIHIDFTDSEATNYGLSATGDVLIVEDILGNQVRQHTFMLYAVYQSINDYDRMSNSGVLLDLQYWLEKYANEQNISVEIDDGTALTGALTKLTCANGMLLTVPDNGGWIYQLQISAEYKIERE